MAHFVITWRAPISGTLYFFRGDNRYEIYLPPIAEETISLGWVNDERFARVFEEFPVFEDRSLSKQFQRFDRLKVYPYTNPILPTQIVRPTRRPKQR